MQKLRFVIGPKSLSLLPFEVYMPFDCALELQKENCETTCSFIETTYCIHMNLFKSVELFAKYFQNQMADVYLECNLSVTLESVRVT